MDAAAIAAAAALARLRVAGLAALYTHPHVGATFRVTPTGIVIHGGGILLNTPGAIAAWQALNRLALEQYEHLASCSPDAPSVLINASQAPATRGAA